MITFCETLQHFFYHPVDTKLICEHGFKIVTECRRCRGRGGVLVI